MPVITTNTTGVFTGYTLAQLRALTLRMLRQSDTVRFSPTAGTADYDWIDDAINRGQEDFVRLTKCLKTYAIIEMQADSRIYRLPDDFLDLMAAYYYDDSLSDGYKEVTITTIDELNDEYSDWRTTTGEPSKLYLDRNYGAGITFGLYPIPDTDGDTIVFNSNNGVLVEWVCPLYLLNQDVGVVIRMTGNDQYVLSTATGVAVEVTPANHNLLIEYARLPQMLVYQGTGVYQYSEIPREYQKAICYYAAADLLSNNPEDSAEYKRSSELNGKFMNEVQTYIAKRKRPMYGHNMRARANVWGYVKASNWYKGIP